MNWHGQKVNAKELKKVGTEKKKGLKTNEGNINMTKDYLFLFDANFIFEQSYYLVDVEQ